MSFAQAEVKAAVKTPEKREVAVSQPKKSSVIQPAKSPSHHIVQLQKTIGNQAVQKLIESGFLQAKLRIGLPPDEYEREADKAANAIMRVSKPRIQRQTEIEEEKEILQTSVSGGRSPETTGNFEFSIQSLKLGGEPLPESVRTFFEPRFGCDLSEVRVHTDSRSACAANALNALAFTSGHDIFFGTGEYKPDRTSGKKLLAHELTHAIQQRHSVGNALMFKRNAEEPKITFKLGMKVTEHPDGRLEVEVVKPWKAGSGAASTYLGMARVAGIDPKLLASELVNSGAYKSLEHVRKVFFVGTRIVIKNGKIISVSTRGKGYEFVEEAWAPARLPERIVFYPPKSSDPTEIILGLRAEKIHEKHKEVPIERMESIKSVFDYLDKIPERYKELSGVKRVAPFISELHFLGHGKPGRFKFGPSSYSTEDLKKIESGKAERHLKPNALIKLDGCEVAAYPDGKRFMCEVGRVFFGNKPGSIWASRGIVVAGESAGNEPITVEWPDCKKEIRRDESLGIP